MPRIRCWARLPGWIQQIIPWKLLFLAKGRSPVKGTTYFFRLGSKKGGKSWTVWNLRKPLKGKWGLEEIVCCRRVSMKVPCVIASVCLLHKSSSDRLLSIWACFQSVFPKHAQVCLCTLPSTLPPPSPSRRSCLGSGFPPFLAAISSPCCGLLCNASVSIRSHHGLSWIYQKDWGVALSVQTSFRSSGTTKAWFECLQDLTPMPYICCCVLWAMFLSHSPSSISCCGEKQRYVQLHCLEAAFP